LERRQTTGIREQAYASGRLVVVVNIAFADIAAYFTPGARIGATHSVIDILVSLCTYQVVSAVALTLRRLQ
jgi:hypothetical protein